MLGFKKKNDVTRGSFNLQFLYVLVPSHFVLFCPSQVKELQKQTGVRIKVVTSNETTENSEAIIVIEESFASGQVSHDFMVHRDFFGSYCGKKELETFL